MRRMTDHERMHVTEPDMPGRYVPPFPGKTAYHWVRRYSGAPAIPLWWNAEWHRNGGEGWGDYAEPDRECKWEYCGPCPSPDDMAK